MSEPVRQEYIVDFPIYTENGQLLVQRPSRVSSITFENLGNVPVVLNNSYPLAPGRFLAIPAEQDQVDTTTYRFTFNATGVASPKPLLAIIRKTYV